MYKRGDNDKQKQIERGRDNFQPLEFCRRNGLALLICGGGIYGKR